MLPGCDQVCPAVTRASVLALRELQKKCFGMTGVPEIVFWRSGAGKTSVLAQWGWREKFYGAAGLARKVFRCSGADKKSVMA